MPSPQISVLMPVWNGERFLAEALESILAQTFTDFELVAVDGGSTDRTSEILSRYDDPRVRIVHAPPGLVPALNFGIVQSRGKWIARQDADDISLPRRLEKQWRALERHPNAVLSYTDVELIGKEAGSIGRARFPKTQALLALKLCYQCALVHSTAMFKKDAALAVGGYRMEEQHAEDYGLWGRLIERGDSLGLPEKLLQFRIHPVSASKRNADAMTEMADKIAGEHGRRFMRLSAEEGERAHAILIAHGRCSWQDWSWFLRCCIPRLRWQSAEMYAWLGLQTLKMFR